MSFNKILIIAEPAMVEAVQILNTNPHYLSQLDTNPNFILFKQCKDNLIKNLIQSSDMDRFLSVINNTGNITIFNSELFGRNKSRSHIIPTHINHYLNVSMMSMMGDNNFVLFFTRTHPNALENNYGIIGLYTDVLAPLSDTTKKVNSSKIKDSNLVYKT
jgi:hypothetical protein